MNTIRFALDGFCKGARPINNSENNIEMPWYRKLVEFIANGNEEEALELAKTHFSAKYTTGNIPIFEEHGIKFLNTRDVSLSCPFIEHDADGNEVVLFRWIGASFLMEAPLSIAEKWFVVLSDGSKLFSDEIFCEWLGDKSFLQDGCSYLLGSCLYDLEGFGENGCSVDSDSFNHDQLHGGSSKVEDAQEKPNTSFTDCEPRRLEGMPLLNKIKELGHISRSELVRSCGYFSTTEGGEEILHYDVFYDAMMNAKFSAME